MEIVYCGGCGKALLGDDFNRGQARFLDNRPWCNECKPPDKEPITATYRKSSTARIPKVGTTRRDVPTVPPPPPPSRGPLFAVVGVAAAVLLLAVLFSGGSPTPTPVDRTPPRPPVDPRPKPPDWTESERLLKELESFASLAAPDKLLARCEELAPKFRASPQERRFREIEKGAMDRKRGQDAERELEAIRRLIDDDPRYLRAEEVLRRLKAARDAPGARAAEVDRRLADYQKARQESPHEKHAGPYAPDEQGFIRNWLLLGTFPSGLDADHLKTEATHEPVAGGLVGKARWAAYASPEGKIDFFRGTPLNLNKPRDNVVVYAACLIQARDYVASEILYGSDDGVAIWFDGKQVAKKDLKRSLKIDEDRVAVPISPGVHRLLVKVENAGGEFEFALRILTPDGKPAAGLKIWE